MPLSQPTSLPLNQKFKKTEAGEIPVDWEVATIKSVAVQFLNGGTPDTKVERYWQGRTPWITGADFENQKVASIRRRITEEAIKNSATNLIPRGSLLVVTRTGVGKLGIAPFDLAISQDITGVILDKRRATEQFLFWMLDHHAHRLQSFHQGTSINGILREDLEAFPFPLPPTILEQKKIAEILSAVDEAIEKTAAVIEKTKQLKKALMQTLLTRGIGHKKFKKTEAGEIPVDWEITKLGEACIQKPEYGANVSAIDYQEKLPRYVRITDVTDEGFLTTEGKASIHEEDAQPYLLSKGDILFARSGATVGKSYLYRESDGRCAFAGYMIRFKPNRNILLPEFLFQITHSDRYYDWVKGMLRAGAQPNVNGSEYASFEFVLPPIAEQCHIVEILSAVDEQISQEETRKQRLEQLKKALMQVLLTGKVRVRK